MFIISVKMFRLDLTAFPVNEIPNVDFSVYINSFEKLL